MRGWIFNSTPAFYFSLFSSLNSSSWKPRGDDEQTIITQYIEWTKRKGKITRAKRKEKKKTCRGDDGQSIWEVESVFVIFFLFFVTSRERERERLSCVHVNDANVVVLCADVSPRHNEVEGECGWHENAWMRTEGGKDNINSAKYVKWKFILYSTEEETLYISQLTNSFAIASTFFSLAILARILEWIRQNQFSGVDLNGFASTQTGPLAHVAACAVAMKRIQRRTNNNSSERFICRWCVYDWWTNHHWHRITEC